MMKQKLLTLVLSLSLFTTGLLKGQHISEYYQETITTAQSGAIDRALTLAEKATSEAEIQALKGELALLKGRNDVAIEHLDKAIGLLQNNKEQELYVRVLSNKGVLLWNEGKNDQALDFLQEALRIRKALKGNAKEIADTYNNLGLVLNSIGQYKEATEFYIQALEGYKSATPSPWDKIAQTSVNLGITASQAEDQQTAFRYLNQALDLWEENHDKDLPTEAFILSNLGLAYFQSGQVALGKSYLEDALTIYLENYGEKHAEVANTYMLLGDVALYENQYEESLSYFQKALTANSFNFESKAFAHNPGPQEALKPLYQLVILMRKARAFETYYYGYSLKKSHLENALATLIEADRHIELLRANRTSKKDQLALSDLAAEVYEDAQRICLTLDEVSLFKTEYPAKAFYYSEKSKAISLLNALVESDAKRFSKVPTDLLEKENALKADLSYYNTQLALAGTSEEREEIRKTLFELQQTYQRFMQDLEEEYPQYFNLKHNVSVSQVEDVQQSLKANEVLISYSIAPKTDRVYMYIIKKEEFEAKQLPYLNDILRYIKGFRNTVYYRLENRFDELAYQLYKWLIPKKSITAGEKLIFITDGAIGKMPFEALLTEEVENGSDRQYLLQQNPIQYNFSATLLNRSSETNTTDGALLLAPVNFSEASLQTLPGSESETKSIHAMLEENSINSDLKTYTEASEAFIKNNALSNYRFVHMATHGLVNESVPELSCVYFANGDNENDGTLYTNEIYTLSFNAELISLSACETGLGQVARGEGIIGLGRAFTYAGAQNLMVSLWTVSDASTANLMIDFYQNKVAKNMALSEALQQAKLKLLQSSDYSAPYYWAPFILIGK